MILLTKARKIYEQCNVSTTVQCSELVIVELLHLKFNIIKRR